MIYRSTINIERIALSPLDNINSTQFVELVKFGDVATFGVFVDEELYWEFDMSEPSNYERVKMSIYDAIFECETMEELGEALNAIFEGGFGEILIDDEYDEDEVEDDEDEDFDWEDEDDEPHINCGCQKCPYKY